MADAPAPEESPPADPPTADQAGAPAPKKKKPNSGGNIEKYFKKRSADAAPLADELAAKDKRRKRRKWKRLRKNAFIDSEAARGRERGEDGDGDSTPEVSSDEDEGSELSEYEEDSLVVSDSAPVEEDPLALTAQDQEELEEERKRNINKLIGEISRNMHDREVLQRVLAITQEEVLKPGYEVYGSTAKTMHQFIYEDFDRMLFKTEDERIQFDRLYITVHQRELQIAKDTADDRAPIHTLPLKYPRLVRPRAVRDKRKKHEYELVECAPHEWLQKRAEERARAWSLIQKSDKLDAEWRLETDRYNEESRKLEEKAARARGWEAKIFALDTEIPWAKPDAIWGFDRTKPAEPRDQPLPTERPGDMSSQLKAALKKELANHIFDVIQQWSGYAVLYTIEWKREPRGLDRLDDWRMSLARRHALKRLVDSLAQRLGIFAVIEGIETHGGTREKGAVGKVVKKDKKLRTVEAKKRHLNPKGGGAADLSDDEDAAEMEREQLPQAHGEDDIQQKRDEALKEQRTLEMIKAAKLMLEKIDADEIKTLEAKIELKKKDVQDWDKVPAQTLALYVGSVWERIQELRDKDSKSPKDVNTLNELRAAFKKLKEALPNTRVGLSHEHLSVFYAGNTPAPLDPSFFSRQITAPMIRRCTLAAQPADYYCRYCKSVYPADIGVELCPKCEAAPLPECAACEEDPSTCRRWSCPRKEMVSNRERGVYYKWIFLRARHKCVHCPLRWEYAYTENADQELYPSIDEMDPIAYDYSLQHGGGLGAEDVRTDLTWNRTTQNFSNLFIYPMKGARCKLTQHWLRAAGRSCTRLSTLWFYENLYGNQQAAVQMFKNCVFQLLSILNGGKQTSLLSLSPESDHWVYCRLADVPVVQKKKEKHFFLERVQRYMAQENLFIVHGTEAICMRSPGLKRTLAPRFERMCAPKGGLEGSDGHKTLLGWLAQDKDWVTDIYDNVHNFRQAPEIKMFLPRASRCYEIMELKDAYFCMFRSVDEWPEWMPREHEWEQKGCSTAVFKVLYKESANSQELAQRMLAEAAAPGTICFCAHGFPELTYKEFSEVPVHWLAAIGKYMREPYTMDGPPEVRPARNVMLPTGQWVVQPALVVPTKLKTSHFGRQKFLQCLEVLRTLLFRPEGDRQRWPFFYGPSSTGKTSFVARWIKQYYYAEDRVAASGNFAGGDMSDSKRIVLLEEFKSEKMSRSAFVQLLDCGQQVVEPKGQPARNVTNNAVKVLDGNWLPEYKDDSDAILQRLYVYHCDLKHQGPKLMREIGDLITKNWYLVVGFLARREYLADNFAQLVEDCIQKVGTH